MTSKQEIENAVINYVEKINLSKYEKHHDRRCYCYVRETLKRRLTSERWMSHRRCIPDFVKMQIEILSDDIREVDDYLDACKAKGCDEEVLRFTQIKRDISISLDKWHVLHGSIVNGTTHL